MAATCTLRFPDGKTKLCDLPLSVEDLGSLDSSCRCDILHGVTGRIEYDRQNDIFPLQPGEVYIASPRVEYWDETRPCKTKDEWEEDEEINNVKKSVVVAGLAQEGGTRVLIVASTSASAYALIVKLDKSLRKRLGPDNYRYSVLEIDEQGVSPLKNYFLRKYRPLEDPMMKASLEQFYKGRVVPRSPIIDWLVPLTPQDFERMPGKALRLTPNSDSENENDPLLQKVKKKQVTPL
eukprot:GILK01006262.1.p1 GENE.GILK01006262.1~~GILK01006262.1.p1  ORF type:complete len:254 (+),score=16.80 GILK01006262.1:57-764(+)